MAGEVSPLYRATRRALLDALDALAGQHDAVILVGAQAVFLHAGDVDEAIATETKDADLAVNPELLAAAPLIEEAMRRGLRARSAAPAARHVVQQRRDPRGPPHSRCRVRPDR